MSNADLASAAPKGKVRLVIYPGERTINYGGIAMAVGSIYAVHSRGIDRFDMAGGPAKAYDDRGHTADSTPSGHFVLDKKERHVTQNWPNSSIPWGAQLRENNGIVEFLSGSRWIAASGPNGVMTRAIIRSYSLAKKSCTVEQANREALHALYDPFSRKLSSPWNKNDFGAWAWNLKRNGARTAYYIHTTPSNEMDTARGLPVTLTESHGCIHIKPGERDEMVALGYLKEGIEVEIKPYGQAGPPR